MSRKQIILVSLVMLLLFLPSYNSQAVSDPVDIECLSEQSYRHSLEGDEVSSPKAPAVLRNQVLLEIASAVW